MKLSELISLVKTNGHLTINDLSKQSDLSFSLSSGHKSRVSFTMDSNFIIIYNSANMYLESVPTDGSNPKWIIIPTVDNLESVMVQQVDGVKFFNGSVTIKTMKSVTTKYIESGTNDISKLTK